jgi:pre-mRNA-splicing factor ATP-dependent RNA helicase DHX38/PRP16
MDAVDDWNHQLAIKISRALNTVNPNDLLATRVTEIAKTQSREGFVKGLSTFILLHLQLTLLSAAKTFGKFQDSFLSELYAEIQFHVKQEAPGAPEPMQGITVHDADVLEPDPVRPGGLMRKDTVRRGALSTASRFSHLAQRHAFKQPSKPLEPPTPRTSVLGLDRLAIEKRAAQNGGDGSRKKARLDDDEPMFKGAGHAFHVAHPH